MAREHAREARKTAGSGTPAPHPDTLSIPDVMSIGELGRLAGAKVQTIRYYEQVGLMPAPGRTEGNQRFYGRRHLERLSFIRHARELGFPLDDVRELLTLSDHPDQSCESADQIAKAHLKAVESRIDRLTRLKAELQRMIKQCHAGQIKSCRVIEVLADHSHGHCLSPDHEGEQEPVLSKITPAARPGRAKAADR